MSRKTKTDLVQAVAEETGLSKAKSRQVVDAFLQSIHEELRSGGGITLTGFGSFQVIEQGPTRVRNPNSGQIMNIPARRLIKFQPGKHLRMLIS